MTETQKAHVQEIAARIAQGELVKDAMERLHCTRDDLAAASGGALTASAVYRITRAGVKGPAEQAAVRAALVALVKVARERFTAAVRDAEALIAELPETADIARLDSEPKPATAPAPAAQPEPAAPVKPARKATKAAVTAS